VCVINYQSVIAASSPLQICYDSVDLQEI